MGRDSTGARPHAIAPRKPAIVPILVLLAAWGAARSTPAFAQAQNAVHADEFQGSDWCARISAAAAAIQALGPQGGIIDARALAGAQSCSADPFASVTVPLQVLLGPATITASSYIHLPSNVSLIGAGIGVTVLNFNSNPSGQGGFIRFYNGTSAVTQAGLRNLTVRNSYAGGDTYPMVLVAFGSSQSTIENVRIERVSSSALSVSTATCSSRTVTLTLSVTNNYVNGEIVKVAGVNPFGYNGVFQISGVSNSSPSQFQYSVPSCPAAYVAGGTSTLGPSGNGDGLWVQQGATQNKIANLWVDNFNVGMWLYQGATYNQVTNLHVTNAWTGGLYLDNAASFNNVDGLSLSAVSPGSMQSYSIGLYLSEASNHNTITNVSASGFDYGVYVDPGQALTPATGNSISNFNVRFCQTAGVGLYSVTGNVVGHGVSEANKLTGVLLVADYTQVSTGIGSNYSNTVTDVTSRWNGGYGFNIANVRDSRISGEAYGNGYSGVQISNSTGITMDISSHHNLQDGLMLAGTSDTGDVVRGQFFSNDFNDTSTYGGIAFLSGSLDYVELGPYLAYNTNGSPSKEIDDTTITTWSAGGAGGGSASVTTSKGTGTALSPWGAPCSGAQGVTTNSAHMAVSNASAPVNSWSVLAYDYGLYNMAPVSLIGQREISMWACIDTDLWQYLPPNGGSEQGLELDLYNTNFNTGAPTSTNVPDGSVEIPRLQPNVWTPIFLPLTYPSALTGVQTIAVSLRAGEVAASIPTTFNLYTQNVAATNSQAYGRSSGPSNLLAIGDESYNKTTNTRINLFPAGLQLTAGTFSCLPSCASAIEGSMRAVTDSTTSTWGATITGGGTTHVLAYCDGTNWTVAAK